MEPIVKISTGLVLGKLSESLYNNTFYSFRGIPYAEPPIGSLRFKAPLPVRPWSTILDATIDSQECVQRNLITRQIQGAENCLKLNVYTTELPKERVKYDRRPVMFWIHGGGFTAGSGSSQFYGPEFLMTEDIVLVSINYRLGIFGFLSLEDPNLEVPGNAGLKDMVLALKWVQQNISNFGGDPNNVTIFGESAGAAACHYLMLSPMSKGLFQKCILQSGCALNIWAHGRKCAQEISNLLGLDTTNEKKILEHLETLCPEEIFSVAEKLPDGFIASKVRPFGPVVERQHPDAFLTEEPVEILKNGNYTKVPVVIGYTSREGMLTEILEKATTIRRKKLDFVKAIPNFLNIEPDSFLAKYISNEIKQFYYGHEEPSSKTKDQFYQMETDNFFLREMVRSVQYHMITMKCPIFMYRVSIESELNLMKKIFGITEPGVCHADDVGYLFKTPITPDILPNSKEEVAIKRFIKLWTNFARFGDPNVSKNITITAVPWKPVTKEQLYFLDIGPELVMDANPEEERMVFWNNILKLNSKSKL